MHNTNRFSRRRATRRGGAGHERLPQLDTVNGGHVACIRERRAKRGPMPLRVPLGIAASLVSNPSAWRVVSDLLKQRRLDVRSMELALVQWRTEQALREMLLEGESILVAAEQMQRGADRLRAILAEYGAERMARP